MILTNNKTKKAAAFYEIIPNVYLLELPELIVEQQQGFVAWRSLAQWGDVARFGLEYRHQPWQMVCGVMEESW